MAKRKITKQQAEQLKRIHEQRLARAKDYISNAPYLQDTSLLGPEQEGLLIANYGPTVEIEANNGKRHLCKLRQNLGALVSGDKIVWQTDHSTTGVVTAVLPRTNEFGRPDRQGQLRPIAANVDNVMLVVAPQPLYSRVLIDRYLVATEKLNIPASIILNKIDLLTEHELSTILKILAIYTKLGYEVIPVSTRDKKSIKSLSTFLKDKTHVFIGQSGVGKSSLIKALIPDEDIAIGPLAETRDEGTHTTTTARLYHFSEGGSFIDSPGVREFTLWKMSAREIAEGFIDFKEFINSCKFRDCSHQHEPGCAIQEAVKTGLIDQDRYLSYQRIIQS